MEVIVSRDHAALQLVAWILLAGVALWLYARLPGFLREVRIYLTYCNSHKKIWIEAGQGKYVWLEDPFSWSHNYWLCRHAAIKHVFSRAAM